MFELDDMNETKIRAQLQNALNSLTQDVNDWQMDLQDIVDHITATLPLIEYLCKTALNVSRLDHPKSMEALVSAAEDVTLQHLNGTLLNEMRERHSGLESIDNMYEDDKLVKQQAEQAFQKAYDKSLSDSEFIPTPEQIMMDYKKRHGKSQYRQYSSYDGAMSVMPAPPIAMEQEEAELPKPFVPKDEYDAVGTDTEEYAEDTRQAFDESLIDEQQGTYADSESKVEEKFTEAFDEEQFEKQFTEGFNEEYSNDIEKQKPNNANTLENVKTSDEYEFSEHVTEKDNEANADVVDTEREGSTSIESEAYENETENDDLSVIQDDEETIMSEAVSNNIDSEPVSEIIESNQNIDMVPESEDEDEVANKESDGYHNESYESILNDNESEEYDTYEDDPKTDIKDECDDSDNIDELEKTEEENTEYGWSLENNMQNEKQPEDKKKGVFGKMFDLFNKKNKETIESSEDKQQKSIRPKDTTTPMDESTGTKTEDKTKPDAECTIDIIDLDAEVPDKISEENNFTEDIINEHKDNERNEDIEESVIDSVDEHDGMNKSEHVIEKSKGTEISLETSMESETETADVSEDVDTSQEELVEDETYTEAQDESSDDDTSDDGTDVIQAVDETVFEDEE